MFVFVAALPEAQIATKLIESIRSKENLENMSKIIDSLPSVNPELSLYRNSTTVINYVLLIGAHEVVNLCFVCVCRTPGG